MLTLELLCLRWYGKFAAPLGGLGCFPKWPVSLRLPHGRESGFGHPGTMRIVEVVTAVLEVVLHSPKDMTTYSIDHSE